MSQNSGETVLVFRHRQDACEDYDGTCQMLFSHPPC